jgi:hypothetical protein
MSVILPRLKRATTSTSTTNIELYPFTQLTGAAKSRSAQRLLLAANWISASHTRHGKAIFDRYKAALLLQPRWSRATYELANYYSYLISTGKEEFISETTSPALATGVRGGAIAKGQGGKSAPTVPSRNNNTSASTGSVIEKVRTHFVNVLSAIQQYGRCAEGSYEYLSQALPRMLTLWFNYTAMKVDKR